jgi:CBS domain-containing protein
MTSNVATTAPDAPLVDAAREMLRQHVHRLPVVDASGQLVGIISTMDVLKAFANGAPQ